MIPCNHDPNNVIIIFVDSDVEIMIFYEFHQDLSKG